MKKTIVALAVMALAVTASAGLTTSQTWTFDNGDNPAAPTTYDNPNGMPMLNLNGGFWDNVLWLDSFEGADGVWVVGASQPNPGAGEITVDIENYVNDNPLKKVTIEIMYYTPSLDPMAYVLPEGDETMVLHDEPDIVEMGAWSKAVYEYEFRPNPSMETIVIRPKLCTSYIDEISVHTECIPEPITIALLGFGGLFLRKRS